MKLRNADEIEKTLEKRVSDLNRIIREKGIH